ncbi:MAG TPA: kynureninase [Acidimicrobiales bacterium]|jgi:kynureninase|nr:kynureninase [Acidimicrobiales bacterium]
MNDLQWTRQRCEALDAADPLGFARERFFVPEGLIYLDGNSLGCLPRAVPARLAHVAEQEWGTALVRGWDQWITIPDEVGDRLAPFLGAGPGEVVVIDTVTIALVKLLGAALSLRPDRPVILTTEVNFPTDLYAADGFARLVGAEVRQVRPEQVVSSLDDSVGVLMLTHVDFRSGEMFDLAAVTAAAHAAGALTVWDFCHSVGAVPLDCEAAGVDFAVGCTYKYLNAGPGAPAFIYVRRSWQEQVENPLPGWLGHADPFEFTPAYRPAPGVRRFVTSSPSILGINALDAALDAWQDVSMSAVRAKSIQLSEMFVAALSERLHGEFELASPSQPERRGSQIALRHGDAYAIMQALIARGVVGDFRAPDVCRFGFTPLYLRFADVFGAVEHIAEVVESKEYAEARFSERRAVT